MGRRSMTVFRTIAAGAQVVLVLSVACVLFWLVALAFMLFMFLVPEETQLAAMGLGTLTCLALMLITAVVPFAKRLWRWVSARKGRTVP